jgi:hypothetical protein
LIWRRREEMEELLGMKMDAEESENSTAEEREGAG